MKNSKTALEVGRKVIQIEAAAVSALADRLGDEFEAAVSLLFNCEGRIVISGVGKSGVIGKKIVATLSSTGTSALFMHAADGIHGDMGVLREGDVMIWISKSGNSDEFKSTHPLLRRMKIPVIAMTGNMKSHLVNSADMVLDISVAEEACPNDLAPTASTTATLAMGDALAIAVLKKRNFSEEDFAYLHPGGSLGKKLLLRIDDVMTTGDAIPVVDQNAGFRDIIIEMNTKRFGCVCVVDDALKLVGIITDGDLKRLFEKYDEFDKLTASSIMTSSPKTVKQGSLAVGSMSLMKEHNIMQVIIVNDSCVPCGIIHLHNLLDLGFY